jgi:hypothetical protein
MSATSPQALHELAENTRHQPRASSSSPTALEAMELSHALQRSHLCAIIQKTCALCNFLRSTNQGTSPHKCRHLPATAQHKPTHHHRWIRKPGVESASVDLTPHPLACTPPSWWRKRIAPPPFMGPPLYHACTTKSLPSFDEWTIEFSV